MHNPRRPWLVVLAHLGLGVGLGSVGGDLWISAANACECAYSTWSLEFVSITGDGDTAAERDIWADEPWINNSNDGKLVYMESRSSVYDLEKIDE